MQIYYSRVNGTNDGINGSALQKIVQTLCIAHWTNIVKFQQEPVYSYDKLDKSDMLILGYNKDRHNQSSHKFSIGKGVYTELERAHSKGIPMFFLNLSGKHHVNYLEAIYMSDISILDYPSYQEYAKIDIHDSYQQDYAGKVQAYIDDADELERFFICHDIDLNKVTTVSQPNSSVIDSLNELECKEDVISNNILLLRRKL